MGAAAARAAAARAAAARAAARRGRLHLGQMGGGPSKSRGWVGVRVGVGQRED